MATDVVAKRTKEAKQRYIGSLAEATYKLFTEVENDHDYKVASEVNSLLNMLIGIENAKACDKTWGKFYPDNNREEK